MCACTVPIVCRKCVQGIYFYPWFINKEINAQWYKQFARYLTESKRQSWSWLFWGLSCYHTWLPLKLCTCCCVCPTALIHVLLLLGLQTPLTSLLFLPMGMGWNNSNCFQEMSWVLWKQNKTKKQNSMKISGKNKKNGRWHETSSMPSVWLPVSLS